MGLNTFIIEPDLFQFPRGAISWQTVSDRKLKVLSDKTFDKIVGWGIDNGIPSFRGKSYDSEFRELCGYGLGGDISNRMLYGYAKALRQAGFRSMKRLSDYWAYPDSQEYTVREHFQLISLFETCANLELAMVGNLDSYIFDYLYWVNHPIKTEQYYKYGGLLSAGQIEKVKVPQQMTESIRHISAVLIR